MNKYEALIEHIINNDEEKARALFHDIVVEKSRQIYESLMDEEYTEEDIGGDKVANLVDEISMDETDGIGEGDNTDDLDMDLGDDDGEEGLDDMMTGDEPEMGDEEDLEQKVMDLESELEALKAEFEQLMGDEEGEEDMDMDMDMDMDDSMSADMDDMDDSDKMMEASDEDEMTESMDDDDEMTESVQRKAYPKTAVDLMREYVEKISAPGNTEFTPVGTGAGGDKPAGNTSNPVAGKNDMGGSASNIAKGGSESAPDGQRPTGKAGGFLKNPQEHPEAKKNVNVPGGNKGAQNWYGSKASAKKGEGQTTDGSVPTNKRSIEQGGN